MKRWIERLCWGTAGLALAVLLYFASVAPRLAPYEKEVWMVKASFTTDEERENEIAKAELFGVPAFEQLYTAQGDESVAVYLPKRGTNAHKTVQWFARWLSVEGEVAAMEDLVPSPPAPQPDLYLNVRDAYPVQKKTVAFFARWFVIGGGVSFLAAIVTGALLMRARRRKIVKKVLEIPKELRELQ